MPLAPTTSALRCICPRVRSIEAALSRASARGRRAVALAHRADRGQRLQPRAQARTAAPSGRNAGDPAAARRPWRHRRAMPRRPRARRAVSSPRRAGWRRAQRHHARRVVELVVGQRHHQLRRAGAQGFGRGADAAVVHQRRDVRQQAPAAARSPARGWSAAGRAAAGPGAASGRWRAGRAAATAARACRK